jgi:hypothetical protein
MSGWDWLHAGLEVATYAKAQQAQRQLSEMKTAAEMEVARRALLEAMKSFIFDISRDIQLAEEQLEGFPQQVYIVSKSLDMRLANSGLSAEVFPDFQDKEYVFKTQKKITEVVGKSKASLTQPQIQQSETAIQYVAELPLLQEAISAKSAQDSLRATDENWRKMSSRDGNKKLFIGLGVVGLVITMCVACPMLSSGLSALGSGDVGTMFTGLVMLVIGGAIPAGSIALFVLGGKSNPEYAPLKANREIWKKQLMPAKNWQEVLSTFGDLSTEQFRKMYEERLAFLSLILGGDFQKFLTSGE